MNILDKLFNTSIYYNQLYHSLNINKLSFSCVFLKKNDYSFEGNKFTEIEVVSWGNNKTLCTFNSKDINTIDYYNY